MWSLRDQRVDNWPLMQSFVPTLVLSGLYLIICIFIGPALMKNRQPYEFKYLMQGYNLSQVFISAYICYELMFTGWFSHYNWGCQAVEKDSSDSTQRMVKITKHIIINIFLQKNVHKYLSKQCKTFYFIILFQMIACYLYFLNKFVEFADTFFFIARKKFRNVNRLQLIHHSIMPIYGFALTRWLPGGHETFGGMFNCFIHVIMYGYYFLAALGPHMQKYLWWKRHLTKLQMIQFVCIFIKSLTVVLGFTECGYPWQFSGLMALLMIAFFFLFAEFYVREYRSKKAALKKENNNKVE